MDSSDNIRLFIKSLDSSVDQLESSLAPILKKSLDELIFTTTAGDENEQISKIKFYNNFLYTLIATIFSYLKSVGINTDTHPIMNELNRIKTYMARVKRLQDIQEGKVKTEEQKQQDSKTFLQNVLGGSAGGAAASESMSQPAISSSNFKGTHTKFKDEEEAGASFKSSKGKPNPQGKAMPSFQVKGKPGKITKPTKLGKVTKPKRK